MSSFESEVAETARWLAGPRFAGITRLFSPRQVVEQRGAIPSDSIVARNAAERFYTRLRELFADTLLSSGTLTRGYFEEPFLRRILAEHLSGTRDHTLRLWQLVVFERWHRQYVDAYTGKSLPLSGPKVPLPALELSR